jgi:hypothetical protein
MKTVLLGFACFCILISCTDKGALNLNPVKTKGTIQVQLDTVTQTSIAIVISPYPDCNACSSVYQTNGQKFQTPLLVDSSGTLMKRKTGNLTKKNCIHLV